MRPLLALLGAIDRINYGDLLFPVLLKQALGDGIKTEFDLHAFALVASDLRAYGALQSRPIRDLFDARIVPSGSRVIVVGGEVLCCDWSAAHFYLNGYFTPTQRAIRRILGPESLNRWLAKAYHSPSAVPFVPSERHFPKGVKVAYNAVGGANLAGHADLLKPVSTALLESSFVSVRDHLTRSLLVDASRRTLNPLVTPDSAMLMSEYFKLEELDELVTGETKQLLRRYGKGHYLCIQVKESLGKEHIATIAAQLDESYREHRLPAVLLPIGKAFGHSDHIVLEKIGAAATTPAIIPTNVQLFDVMGLIANAAAFLGTSLHGAITAVSFGVPHFALSGRDLKIPAFLDSWDIPVQRSIGNFEQLAHYVTKALNIPIPDLKLNRLSLLQSAHAGLSALTRKLDLPELRPLETI